MLLRCVGARRGQAAAGGPQAAAHLIGACYVHTYGSALVTESLDAARSLWQAENCFSEEITIPCKSSRGKITLQEKIKLCVPCGMFLGSFPKMLVMGRFYARPGHAVTDSLDPAE